VVVVQLSGGGRPAACTHGAHECGPRRRDECHPTSAYWVSAALKLFTYAWWCFVTCSSMICGHGTGRGGAWEGGGGSGLLRVVPHGRSRMVPA
jgi:hypothetical protein